VGEGEMQMAEIVITILMFAMITFVTAVVFGGWVVYSIVRLIFRAIGALFGISSSRYSRTFRMPSAMTRTCPNARCLQTNAADAHFCKRCGQAFPQAQRVAVRRAAMW